MNLKTENYKGYAIKFMEKIIDTKKGNQKIVHAESNSKVTGKVLGNIATSKEAALVKVKKMIDLDVNYKKKLNLK